jgi:phage anti-repressor protein
MDEFDHHVLRVPISSFNQSISDMHQTYALCISLDMWYEKIMSALHLKPNVDYICSPNPVKLLFTLDARHKVCAYFRAPINSFSIGAWVESKVPPYKLTWVDNGGMNKGKESPFKHSAMDFHKTVPTAGGIGFVGWCNEIFKLYNFVLHKHYVQYGADCLLTDAAMGIVTDAYGTARLTGKEKDITFIMSARYLYKEFSGSYEADFWLWFSDVCTKFGFKENIHYIPKNKDFILTEEATKLIRGEYKATTQRFDMTRLADMSEEKLTLIYNILTLQGK